MAINYTEAQEVAVGEITTSRKFNLLCNAFNDRIVNGVGDPAWRICWYAFSFTRQMRNPQSGLSDFPPVDEFLKFAAYRESGPHLFDNPGDPAGANVGSALPKFVFGNISGIPTMESEAERLHGVNAVPLNPTPGSDRVWWDLGKTQRGLTEGDLFTPGNQVDSPSLIAADSHNFLGSSDRSKSNLSYGGFFPTPRIVRPQPGQEAIYKDPDVDWGTQPIIIREYVFTSLVDSPTLDKTFFGFGLTVAQQEDTPHMDSLAENVHAYYITLVNGDKEILSKNEFLLGPFTGSAFLNNAENDLINIGMHKYCAEFRGSTGERVEPYRIRDFTFDNQKFWTKQYLLSPARGLFPGGVPTDDTPVATFSGGIFAPELATWEPGGGASSYTIATDFVASAYLIDAPALSVEAQIEVLVDGQPIGTHAILSGQSLIVVLDETKTGVFTVNALNDFDATSPMVVEILEQIPLKPTIADEYLLIRSASSQVSFGSREQQGQDVSEPKDYSTIYFQKAAIPSESGSFGLPTIDALSENAFYNEMRTFLINCVRMIGRDEGEPRFTDYYTENGKSVIECKRTYDFGGESYDAFAGIADAITDTAPANGFSNEWVMFFSWLWYRDAGNTIQKLNAYPDIMGHLNNPAWLKSEELLTGTVFSDVARHFILGYNESVTEQSDPTRHDVTSVIVAEAPSGYNFVKGGNNPDQNTSWNQTQKDDFYRSAQIYQKPYKIESVTDIGSGLVKITFTERFRRTPLSPASIPRVASYNIANLLSSTLQPYATDENRIMKYLARFVRGVPDAMPPIIGDFSPSVLGGDPGSFVDTGCIVPRGHMVKLMEKVFEDGNDIANPFPGQDTRYFHDSYLKMTFYLRAMCEGYVDQQSTDQGECINVVSKYDFTFQELMRQATGSRNIKVIPDAVRNGTPSAFGHGPLPGQTIYAADFNQYVEAINLLVEARTDLA